MRLNRSAYKQSACAVAYVHVFTVWEQTDLWMLFSVMPGTSCNQPYVPVNGEFICSEEEAGVNCTLLCKEGYSFTQDAVHSYLCAYNGVWEPPYSPDRPDCSGEGMF